ncbi:histidine phosphatase family protein [Pseudarthrobacter sp. CC12]|uniref:histidine phosphatase family protein n=1 Tax=unclassified Pseudarthrobacter TaxID=2647000 RepID=UPI001132555F|nr:MULTISPECIES: histidine phosphatase family protein [unclassified Pseudarthrobacter]QDG61901.1 histidine phosphatase family protein [Pseudarthrobacter sp. NIBRBAC000502771]QDG90054.1 histidine phosphatase family protein [Pseudarthrobacter sp. NIBRBAC000502770]
MKLLLIRHGETPGNVLGQLDTDHPGPGLTELGERQAEAMARSLVNEPIGALYASTLIRTQITAAPLGRLRGLETTVLEGLHEIEAGALEKLTDHESHKRYMGTVISWAAGELDNRMPAGPDGHAFFDRFDAAIARVVDRASGQHNTVAVVSHGAAIRTWAGLRADGIDHEFAARHVLANTGIVALEGDPDTGWKLIHWEGSPVGGLALADPAAGDPTGRDAAAP